MRLIAFVLAFIVLALSCLPCADGAFAIKAGKTKTEFVKVSDQQNGQEHNDACSPFCQCACCAGFSVNHNIASISTLPIICRKKFTCHLPANTVNISLPIWQPPQLVS